jgi:hypothetical protein
MTKQKSFKGRVRARMDKTSESYTTARRQLLAKSRPEAGSEASSESATPTPPAERTATPAPPAAAGATPAQPEGAAGAKRPYSDEVVRANTGWTWEEWFALLDAWGGAERPHPEIARWLVGEHGVPGWWAQGVTVGYEQARGLRAPGQRRGGLFEVNASRTVAVPVDRLYEASSTPPCASAGSRAPPSRSAGPSRPSRSGPTGTTARPASWSPSPPAATPRARSPSPTSASPTPARPTS